MEKWYIHPACNPNSIHSLLALFSFIREIFEKHERTIFVDLTRVHVLFNEKGELIKEHLYKSCNLWSNNNPFPIYIIDDVNEAINLWNKALDSSNMFCQSKDYVEWLFKISKLDKSNIPIICQDVREFETPLYTLYLIQILNHTKYVLTTDPNTTMRWYCRYCAKKNAKHVCSRCYLVSKECLNSDNCAKPGIFYCDIICQKGDWFRHKLECMPHKINKITK